jgi:branched-chain amino acid transport system substrate-binding protein
MQDYSYRKNRKGGKIMKKGILSGFVSSVLAVMLIGIAPVLAQDVIKIGAVAPLSSPGGVETGEALRAGMEIAVDEINAQGGVLGKKIELVMGDTGGLPEKGTAVVERLITKDKVAAITGEAHSSVALAEIEVTHKYGVPIVICEAWSDTITAKGYPEVFRITVSNSHVYSIAVDWIKAVGFKHVAVIAENSDWGLGLTKIFVDNLKKANIKVTPFSAERTVVDFTPQLLQLKRMTPPPDLIIDGFTGPGEILMIKQAYELGLAPSKNTAIFGAGMDVLYPGFWETAKEGGVYALGNPAGLPGIPTTEVSKRFEAAFKKKYNRVPDAVAMEGFDGVYVIAEAMKSAGSADPKKITQALENIKWTGTRGTITFFKGHDPDWMYHQWPDVPVFVIQYTKLNQAPDQAAILWPKQYATVKELLLKP